MKRRTLPCRKTERKTAWRARMAGGKQRQEREAKL